MTAKELFNQLNMTDEVTHIEAKSGTGISKSVMETICAFANEPGLEEGYILLGAVIDESSLFPQYIIDPISDSDKLQSALATNCASMFNRAIRPEIAIQQINGKNVAVIKVKELPQDQKPLYFKKDGLPSGAYRRIGPTDHRCTDDDMHVFFTNQRSFDKSFLDHTSLNDIDERALGNYRKLRKEVNPVAEELFYDDVELLQALGCYATDGTKRLSVAGMILFGKSSSLRRIFPMQRVDYIRVPGTRWVSDPDDRYTTIDMRGPLLTMVYRIVDAVYADLPKGFKLEEGLQASSTGLPVKVLREAIVNALMHRSYRKSSPIQVIRYDNRLEIINPGFSLKSEYMLGTPGSELRNPFVAAVFHETNLAETKGSGIRAMKRMLIAAELAPPTFNSSRTADTFTARLLLHHFLSKSDIEWLMKFEQYNLNDSQKRALIFLRETGAIDNQVYRQLSDVDVANATKDLRQLRKHQLVTQQGKGRYTYYRPTEILLNTEPQNLNTEPSDLSTEPHELNTEPQSAKTHGESLMTHGNDAKTHDKMANTEGKVTNTEGEATNTDGKVPKTYGEDLNTESHELSTEPQATITHGKPLMTHGDSLMTHGKPLMTHGGDQQNEDHLTEELRQRINALKERERYKEVIKSIIYDLCSLREYSLADLATLLSRDEKYLRKYFVKPMLDEGKLTYKYPTMIKHPDQAYKAIVND
jgi:ATP-dependent DNA helicase RecG